MLYLIDKAMPPKKDGDGKKPSRFGRSRAKEEEPTDAIPPPSEKETILKEE